MFGIRFFLSCLRERERERESKKSERSELLWCRKRRSTVIEKKGKLNKTGTIIE